MKRERTSPRKKEKEELENCPTLLWTRKSGQKPVICVLWG